VLWTYGDDAADQLTSAVKAAEPTQAVLTRYAYGYDPAGNRTAEQIDDQVTGASYDGLNRLMSQEPSGALMVAGTVSELATVSVQGVAVPVTTGNAFTARPEIGVGTNTLTITATDVTGNTATAQYEVDSAGAGRTFTYDANGNLTSDGTRIFEWDAANRSISVVTATGNTQFEYDGFGRRSRITTTLNGSMSSVRRLIWCDLDL
jgi:YD repeat-containing protein